MKGSDIFLSVIAAAILLVMINDDGIMGTSEPRAIMMVRSISSAGRNPETQVIRYEKYNECLDDSQKLRDAFVVKALNSSFTAVCVELSK